MPCVGHVGLRHSRIVKIVEDGECISDVNVDILVYKLCITRVICFYIEKYPNVFLQVVSLFNCCVRFTDRFNCPPSFNIKAFLSNIYMM